MVSDARPARGCAGRTVKNEHPLRGRSLATGEPARRPTEVRESEGCVGALKSGNGLAVRTRQSKGGPC